MNNLANSYGEDLFNVISDMDRVIVDNCAEWKHQSLKEPNKAFILGRTISNEADNLEGVRWTPKTGPQVKMDFRWSAGEEKADDESKTQTA